MNSTQNHTDLLNYLAATFNLQSYLEIGVRKPELNFDKIKLPNSTIKFGVDPEINETHSLFKQTSDEFFADIQAWENYFDLIFIDGDHTKEQVKRDFENSLKCLTDRGFVVIHDTLPTHEKYTHVPRNSRIWFGDVYKFAMNLDNYEGIEFMTVDIDCGCTVIHKTSSNVFCKEYKEITWSEYLRDRYYALQIATVEQFKHVHDFIHGHIL